MTKRKIFKRYRTKKRGGQHYWVRRKLKRRSFGSHPSSSGIRDMERFREINNMILRRKESILMGSDTLSPETARKIAMDQLVGEGKIKRDELKNRGSSPRNLSAFNIIEFDYPTPKKTKLHEYGFKSKEEATMKSNILNNLFKDKEFVVYSDKDWEKLKKKNLGSSPTTGTAKPSDTLLFEALQRDKKLKKKSEFKKKFGIDLGEIEDLESR